MKKKFLIFVFMFIFAFSEVCKANQIPIGNAFKQGTYTVSPEHEGLYRYIKLITSDKNATVTILDSTNVPILFVKLTSTQDFLKIGPIKRGETLIVGGEGEITITH